MGILKKTFSKFQKIKTFFKRRKYKYRYRGDRKMRVNIITDKDGWILNKFATSVCEQLQKLGYEAITSYEFKSDYDINHYFRPGGVGLDCYTKVDQNTTFMITHVDTQMKLDEIKDLTKKGAIGICMSRDTRDKMLTAGVPANKVCYINPAQDGVLTPKKTVLGITHTAYKDTRKRNEIIIDVCKQINNKYFKLVIMGLGWEEIVNEIRNLGFEIDYYDKFDKQIYNKLIMDMDYYCYFGTDEGSMGYLDAVAAGIGTIVTPQGYHLDTNCPITYPVNTVDDIVSALKEIEKEKEAHFKFVETWTWENYTLKHLEIWKYMLGYDTLENLLSNRARYVDGIFSLFLDEMSYKKKISSYLKSK